MEETISIPDSFVTSVLETGGGLKITIPSKLCTYMGLKKGDTVKVLIKKVQPNEDEKNESR